MRKKTIIAAITITGLLLSLVGMQYADVAKANPNIWPGPTPTYVNVPNSQPPIMTIISPKNGTPCATANINFELNVREPEPEPDGFSLKWFAISYTSDWQKSNYEVRDDNYNNSLESYNSSFTMANVPDGNHSATVTVSARFFKTTGPYTFDYYILSCSSLICFTVDTVSPSITNLNAENSSNQEGTAVNFDTNESTSWIGYSLDNAMNETVNRNFTLNNLSEGTHSLVIFANDTYGNMRKSDTIFLTFFRDANPTPSPIRSGPNTKANSYTDWIPYGLIVLVVALGASAVVYFRRRKAKGCE